tara:strand:- start:876 stop:2159 length:1284 start_codon:yes stop_codon:yes gene_type:complete
LEFIQDYFYLKKTWKSIVCFHGEIKMTLQGKNTEVLQEEETNLNNVGALLKASRIRLGHDLRSVAQTLHIRYIYLEAIEDGRYEELPGAVYVAGFMRSYADFLGLDSEEVVRRSKDEIASQSVNTELVFPEPIPETSLPGGAVVLIGVVIFFLAYGGWYVGTTDDTLNDTAISSVPEHLSSKENKSEAESKTEPIFVADANEPLSESLQSTESEAKEKLGVTESNISDEGSPVQKTQATQKVVDKPKTEQIDFAAQTSKKKKANITDVEPEDMDAPSPKPVVNPQPKTEPLSVESTESTQGSGSADIEKPMQSQSVSQTPLKTENNEESKIYGTENEDFKILVRARRNSWIQVRDNNANKLLLTQLLKTGDSYQVPNKSGLVLLTGNAGALEILVEGKPVPDLAPPGTILKNITLDPDKLRLGSAAQ